MEQAEAVPHEHWFKRHWKILALVAGALTVLTGCVIAFVFGLMSLMKSSTPVQLALSKARHDPTVIARLGEPVRDGIFMSGNISINNDSGSADCSVPLSGPKGSGTLYLEATRRFGKWKLQTLEFVGPRDDQQVDLLAEQRPSPTTQ